MSPTGKQIAVDLIIISDVEHGRIVREYELLDEHALYQQLAA